MRSLRAKTQRACVFVCLIERKENLLFEFEIMSAMFEIKEVSAMSSFERIRRFRHGACTCEMPHGCCAFWFNAVLCVDIRIQSSGC